VRPLPDEKGMSLIEVMVAVALMVIAAVGVAQMTRAGTALNADSRRITRASTIALDLLSQIQTWDYDDPRLANTTTANDNDYGDATQSFETATTFTADHAEADLTLNGLDWNGLPAADLTFAGYQRYWNVAELDDTNANGIPDAKRIAVIVRWPHGMEFRRIVLYTAKVNPSPDERL
jgi:prepilin-type N-terminal cleavage/methylation domain-containing protein